MSSNESKLLRAAFIPTFLTSGFAILISTLVRGLPGFLGAVLGTVCCYHLFYYPYRCFTHDKKP
jgi:hypothetical protein